MARAGAFGLAKALYFFAGSLPACRVRSRAAVEQRALSEKI
jgi:hypothetical protein